MMYAIIEFNGEQKKVEPKAKVVFNHVRTDIGKNIEIDKVLLISNEKVEIGTPYIAGAKVICKVLAHTRGKKTIAFKYKKKAGFRKTIGHRQDLTELLVEDIVSGKK